MTTYTIYWEGAHGRVVPIEEQYVPDFIHNGAQVFNTETEALETLVGDLDAAIVEIRSARRTAMKQLRKLKKSA